MAAPMPENRIFSQMENATGLNPGPVLSHTCPNVTSNYALSFHSFQLFLQLDVVDDVCEEEEGRRRRLPLRLRHDLERRRHRSHDR